KMVDIAPKLQRILLGPAELLPENCELRLHLCELGRLLDLGGSIRLWRRRIFRGYRFNLLTDALQRTKNEVRQQRSQEHRAGQSEEKARREPIKRRLQQIAQEYGPDDDAYRKNRIGGLRAGVDSDRNRGGVIFTAKEQVEKIVEGIPFFQRVKIMDGIAVRRGFLRGGLNQHAVSIQNGDVEHGSVIGAALAQHP